MKSTYRAAAVAVMVTVLLVNPVLLAGGNPIPGRWEKVTQIKPGEKLNVLMKSGVSHQCRYQSIEDETLLCSSGNQEALKLDLVAIDKVVVPKAAKYAQYGALLGALGGLGASALIIAGADGSASTGGFISFMAVCAGLGAAAGAGIGGSGETVFISKEAARTK